MKHTLIRLLCAQLACSMLLMMSACSAGKNDNLTGAPSGTASTEPVGGIASTEPSAAPEETEDPLAKVELPEPDEILMTGRFGENITYTFDSNGILTVSGTGPMDKIEGEEYPNLGTDVLYVVIEEGVTKTYNISMCYKVKYVSLPSTMEKIGLSDLDEMTTVILADGITKIKDEAFLWCDALTSLELPDSITEIGKYAFASCDNLSEINMPANLKSLGAGAFSYTAITEFTAPRGLTSLPQEVFAGCESLKSVTLHSGITSIGDHVFYKCSSLTDVYYEGSEAEFNLIRIGEDNDPLLNANIHFNSKM